MEPVSLLIGIVAGGGVASAIWIIANSIISNKGKAERDERNAVISSIGERVAETDSLLVSFSAGAVSKERLKGQIIKNIDAIQSLYKPNLHLFEVFYAKYIDTLITRYAEYLKNLSTVEKQAHEVVDHITEATAVAVESPIIVKEKEVIPSPAPEIMESVTDHMKAPAAVAIAEPAVEEEKEVSEILLSSKNEPAKEDFSSRDVEFSIEPVATEHFEVLPVEDADMPEIQPQVQDLTNTDELRKDEAVQIASASVPQEQEADISFEAMAQDVMSVEDENAGTKSGFPHINKNAEIPAHPIKGMISPNSNDEEEFSMETIMDLDMSRIPSFNAEKSNITIKPTLSKSVSIDHPLKDTQKIYTQPDQTANGSSIKTPGAFIKQPSDIHQKAPTAAAGAATVTNNNLESSQTEPVVFENQNHHPTDKENYGITGDDVADQIDSFFGFGNK
ncbi:MAG TPA: hypothetical protein VHO70_20290 [Chitinispirillaceae bacterium]|nr:hypothetical protein [Chitinispirillaceae bacterium]